MTDDTTGTETFFWDKFTGEPCPRRGNVLCTLPYDPEHRHVHYPVMTGTETAGEACPSCDGRNNVPDGHRLYCLVCGTRWPSIQTPVGGHAPTPTLSRAGGSSEREAATAPPTGPAVPPEARDMAAALIPCETCSEGWQTPLINGTVSPCRICHPTEARGLGERLRELVDECANSGCIHLNEMYGKLRALLARDCRTGDGGAAMSGFDDSASGYWAEVIREYRDAAQPLAESASEYVRRATAPETEGRRRVCTCWRLKPDGSHEAGCPFAAQPAAEGAREDDGLATLADVIASEGWCCDPYGHDDGPPSPGECGDCDRLREDTARAILASDWLAEDRRRARAEGGAEALEEAADDLLLDCSHFNRYRGKPEWCGYCESAVNMLRDRAAGLRETGGKGQSPRDTLLTAAARLTDMGISARAAELLTEWAHE